MDVQVIILHYSLKSRKKSTPAPENGQTGLSSTWRKKKKKAVYLHQTPPPQTLLQDQQPPLPPRVHALLNDHTVRTNQYLQRHSNSYHKKSVTQQVISSLAHTTWMLRHDSDNTQQNHSSAFPSYSPIPPKYCRGLESGSLTPFLSSRALCTFIDQAKWTVHRPHTTVLVWTIILHSMRSDSSNLAVFASPLPFAGLQAGCRRVNSVGRPLHDYSQ